MNAGITTTTKQVFDMNAGITTTTNQVLDMNAGITISLLDFKLHVNTNFDVAL